MASTIWMSQIMKAACANAAASGHNPRKPGK
jgi:hypothetical protein